MSVLTVLFTTLLALQPGLLQDDRILDRQLSHLERGKLKTVRAIVLHRTNATTAAETLKAYRDQQTGAHFLIDVDGTIYQTVRLDQKSWHVGLIKPRCQAEKSCSPNDLVAFADAKATARNQQEVETALHTYEMHKPYPLRYPSNEESLGIEVVGKADAHDGYGRPTDAQLASLRHLIEILKSKFQLHDSDVYTHGVIGHNLPSEGEHLGY